MCFPENRNFPSIIMWSFLGASCNNFSTEVRAPVFPGPGGVGEATLGTGAAVDVAGVAWSATENAVCDGVGQLSDPLEGHVI